MDFSSSFKDPHLCHSLLERLTRALEGQPPLRFMEVCGTHTVAIFQSGLRDLLPASVTHLSGPGCPVCVTHDAEVATFVQLAGREGVIVATFGDLMRVPGPDGLSLKHAQAAGARVEIVYSPLDMLTLAAKNPHDTVVFLGVGFETTAPTVGATLLMAREQGITNAKVLSFHKLVPPALQALISDPSCAVDAFLLPGHVSTILGLEPYAFLAETFATPSVVAGFEPVDILSALCILAEQRRKGQAEVINAYPRAVNFQGNPKARDVLAEVFTTSDALWRGLGLIPRSGLTISPAFAQWDALQTMDISIPTVQPLRGCKCGDVLKGKIAPPQCPLFNTTCTPANPVGPCMVSTEGSCAAYAKYHWEA